MRRKLAAVTAASALALAGVAAGASLPGIPAVFQPYRSWTKVNAKPILPTPTTAHPAAVKNVYASRRKRGSRYPYGTIIVKEGLNRSGGSRFVSLIATMRKVRGSDPAHGDWRFTEWSRPGPKAPFSVLAKDTTCWSCHALAKKTDWVFTQR